jgi:hypothetical protein
LNEFNLINDDYTGNSETNHIMKPKSFANLGRLYKKGR